MEDKEKLYEFLRQFYYNDLLMLTKEDKPALVIDFNMLDRFDPVLAEKLLEQPLAILEAFEEAVGLFDMGIKLPIRVKSIPDNKNVRLRNLRAEHIGRMLVTDIIVKSASEVKPQIDIAIFECPECMTRIEVEQEDGQLLQKAGMCKCGRRGDFPLVEKKMTDYRWLKGVEPFEVTSGEQPSELAILLREDLTTPKVQKKSDPGNRLRIVGVLKELPKRIKGKMTTKLDTFIDVNYLETTEIDFEDLTISPEDEAEILQMAHDPHIYDKLKSSIAPGIYGFDEIKEALVLQLFGGAVHRLPDGTHIRGNIHMLLTGDPGVGKSVMLKLITSTMPRAKYVSGTGVSGPGLTASVRKDEILGSWVLEAGALILCNKGLISIDEFDKINKDDQIAMHEAMSVETVSIAKANIVATLPAQTAVLAGANPKMGRFDMYRPIGDQIGIPETLMSRFDLKFALRDLPEKGKDARLAGHIVASRLTPDTVVPMIGKELMRKYLAYARKIEDIELTKDAAQMLEKFYVDMRGKSAEGSVAITLRQFEALLRLAEASAKVRLDTKIRIEDAERSIRLMQFSLQQLGFDTETGTYDIDKAEGGMAAAQRSKRVKMLEAIDGLQKAAGGKEVSVEDIVAEAESLGISSTDAHQLIEKMKQEGLVFEPKPGFIRKL